MNLREIKESFDFFECWEDKYRFIIDLGKELAPFPEHQRLDKNLVRGCQSQVWLDVHMDENTGKLQLRLDSDAHIVRGLGYIVLAASNDKTPMQIADVNMLDVFEQLELMQHLSPTRGNGLRALVARIEQLAQSSAH